MTSLDVDLVTEEQFKAMPLVVKGESKEVRYAGGGLVVIKLLPTIYSFTHNRCGEVEGSDLLRLQATAVFLEVLRSAGIKHAYRQVGKRYILSELILQPAHRLDRHPFRPADLTPEQSAKMPEAPPIEVIVKAFHTGTSKHRYHGMDGYPLRKNHPFCAGTTFDKDGPYPQREVRFDWRNPLTIRVPGPDGTMVDKRLADEVLGDDAANRFIDVAVTKRTALDVYDALAVFLNTHDIVCCDLCLFIADDGKTVFGEISQDCGRWRHFDYGELDKDVWRAGGSSQQVLEKWALLVKLISEEVQS